MPNVAAPAVENLEHRLNDFDPEIRTQSLQSLSTLVNEGNLDLPAPGRIVNLHSHTFFSFNGYGYSPSAVAWKTKKLGLGAVGLVDFDVLDGIDEFHAACRLLGLRSCAGIETRVFVPEFASREINSPGEPGIAYHVCVGFSSSKVSAPGVLPELKSTAQARNRGVAERVNSFLYPVTLDYDLDVLPLTPQGNATERHLCIAYDNKARELMPNEEIRARFWSDKLQSDPTSVKRMSADAPVFQAFIRAKLMKSGGPGYVKAQEADFPQMEDFNAFGIAAGAIPTFAWLDGTSEGERAIDELLDLTMAKGVAALNVIPDRNWNIKDPEARRTKVAQLHRIVNKAGIRGLPLIVGTEMNAYGQRFVDDFSVPDMAPLVKPAWDGALILHAHTLLQGAYGLGYLSAWAKSHFTTPHDKNAFFRQAGELLTPDKSVRLPALNLNDNPQQILAVLTA